MLLSEDEHIINFVRHLSQAKIFLWQITSVRVMFWYELNNLQIFQNLTLFEKRVILELEYIRLFYPIIVSIPAL